MADTLSDAELVERLKYRDKHTANETASYFGIKGSTLRQSIIEAKAKGLTANTIVKDELLVLKSRIKLLQKEVDTIRIENHKAEEIRKTIYGLAKQIPDPPK